MKVSDATITRVVRQRVTRGYTTRQVLATAQAVAEHHYAECRRKHGLVSRQTRMAWETMDSIKRLRRAMDKGAHR